MLGIFTSTNTDWGAAVANWGITGSFTPSSTTSYAQRIVTPYLQFPATGYRSMVSGEVFQVGTVGHGWSASAAPINYYDQGYCLRFTSSIVNPSNSAASGSGLTVRCVHTN